MHSVTMKDIADRLGISAVSVSKALNNKEGIGPQLRQQILNTAEEMGYKSKKAIQLAKETRLIGIVLSRVFLMPSPSFYWSLYERLLGTLQQRNYQSLIEIISFTEEENEPSFLQRSDLDGIIVIGYVETKYLKRIEATGKPLIMLDSSNEKIHGMSIVPDNSYSVFSITNLLVESGHRKIGYVGNIMAMPNIMDRYLGYYRSLLVNHIELNKDWIIEDRSDDMRIFNEFDLPEDMPTAFVCNSDQTAFSFVDYLTRKGYRVPEDVSVVGFYDYAYAKLCHPPLTTVKIDIDEVAEIAADVLYKRIEYHTNPSNNIQVFGKIVERDSVRKI